jgi:hypothetical protein
VAAVCAEAADPDADLGGLVALARRSDDAITAKTPAHEAIGRHISFLAPTDRMDEVPHLIRRILAGENVEQFGTVRRSPSGAHGHVLPTLGDP